MKVYGQPYTVYSLASVFWEIPLRAFAESRYITITIPIEWKDSLFNGAFLWLWSHLNGITPDNNEMNRIGLSYADRRSLLELAKRFGAERNFNLIFSFLDSLYIGVGEIPRQEVKDIMKGEPEAIRHFNTLPIVAPGVREVPVFDSHWAIRSGAIEAIAPGKLFPTLDLYPSRYEPSNCFILQFDVDKFYIATSEMKPSFYIFMEEAKWPIIGIPLPLGTYYSNVDIGQIVANATRVRILSGYILSTEEFFPIATNIYPIPSVPREIYYHSDLPSLFKFSIGPYLLEGSPLTIRSRSPYFEALWQSEKGGEKGTKVLSDDKEMDYNTIVYIWSYLCGMTDDVGRPNHHISYESLLKCWKYISYFQIPLSSTFVMYYINQLFERAPKWKDLRVHDILKDIHKNSSYEKITGRGDSLAETYENRVFKKLRDE